MLRYAQVPWIRHPSLLFVRLSQLRAASVPEMGIARPSAAEPIARRVWKVAQPAIPPKWKAPGIKRRLLIDKHDAPGNMLHSTVVMDAMPRQVWCDGYSMDEVATQTWTFNAELGSRFEQRMLCYHAAFADMGLWFLPPTPLGQTGMGSDRYRVRQVSTEHHDLLVPIIEPLNHPGSGYFGPSGVGA